MTGTSVGTSYRGLNAVLEQARGDPGSVLSVSDEQLLALQSRWTTALAARLDEAIEVAGPGPMVDTIAAAWRELADDQPVLRGVLDGAEEHSAALSAAMSTEFRYLAMAAGTVQVDDPAEEAVRMGRDYRNQIRSETPSSAVRRSRWSAVRLRGALAMSAVRGGGSARYAATPR